MDWPLPPLAELSDDELWALTDAILEELTRRRRAARPRTFLEDVRESIRQEGGR